MQTITLKIEEFIREFDIINYDEVKGLVVFMTIYLIFFEGILPRLKKIYRNWLKRYFKDTTRF